MNVVPIRPQSVAERHVQFSEFVEVRHITPTETAPIRPSMYAQRLARELRNQSNVDAQPHIQPTQSRPVRAYKNVMHTAAMVFGTLILPSFACLVLGPIGLIAPVVLAVLAIVCAFLGGRPTEAMEQARAERAEANRNFDPR